MSDWTNLEEIMQDLSLAQGQPVPGTVETVASVGPPPIHVPDEESVERAYNESHCVGAADLAPPDYEQIQMMLDLVKIDKEEEEEAIQSSKLDPLSPEFVPKEKIKINVAPSSTAKARETELPAVRPISKERLAMYRRRTLSLAEAANRHVYSVPETSQLSPEKNQKYTLAERTSAFYSKYLSKSNLKEKIAEDIWVKAQKQMRDIEARQREQEERQRAGAKPENTGTKFLILPDHRHLTSHECIVCIVAAKHGFYF